MACLLVSDGIGLRIEMIVKCTLIDKIRLDKIDVTSKHHTIAHLTHQIDTACNQKQEHDRSKQRRAWRAVQCSAARQHEPLSTIGNKYMRPSCSYDDMLLFAPAAAGPIADDDDDDNDD